MQQGQQQQFLYELAEHVNERLITLKQGLLNLQRAGDSEIYELIAILNSIKEGAEILGLNRSHRTE